MLIFAYACPVKYGNPMGHRIMKKVSTPTQTHTTLYSRDAQGNVLATYDFIPWMIIDGPRLDKPNEMMIYGSSRLGVKRPLQQRANSITNHATESLSVSSGFFPKPFAEVQAEVCGNSGPETYVEPALDHTDVNYFRKHINESSTYLVSTVFGNPPMSYLYPEFTCSKNLTHTRLFTGMSEYELSNHLGNVLATVKDEPILTPEASLSPSNEVAFTKKPLILTAQDYYPFGMVMPNRSFSLGGSNYRFGFNTQEKDDEVYGKGNLMSAKFWEYDTRLGRRWNTDPVVKVWESLYLVNSGNPIWYSDVNGDDGENKKDRSGKNTGWSGDVIDKDGNQSKGDFSLKQMQDGGLRPLGKETVVTPKQEFGKKDAFDAVSSLIIGVELKMGTMKTSDLSKMTYDGLKKIKQYTGIKLSIRPQDIYKTAPQWVKNLGLGMTLGAGAYTAYDILDKGKVKGSHVYDLSMLYLGSKQPYVGLGVFTIDVGLKLTNSKSIGQRIDEAIDNKPGSDNDGVLIDINKRGK